MTIACLTWNALRGPVPAFPFSASRKKLDKTDKEDTRKKLRRTESINSIGAQAETLRGEVASLRERLETWSEVVNKVISSGEHNGLQKEPSMNWIEFFEGAIGRKIDKPPVHLLTEKLEFEVALEHISMLKATLRKDLLQTESKFTKCEQRLRNQQKKVEDKEQKNRAKAVQAIEDLATGEYKTKQEEQRTLISTYCRTIL